MENAISPHGFCTLKCKDAILTAKRKLPDRGSHSCPEDSVRGLQITVKQTLGYYEFYLGMLNRIWDCQWAHSVQTAFEKT